ncbi:MAG: DUF1289 domain-containing protein [Halioglobus sp.]
MNDAEVRSPCVSICVLDDYDICMGCYRSAAEITDWVMMSNDEKREVLEKTRERFEASNPIRLG